MLFQGQYHTPSFTPSPPASPGRETTIIIGPEPAKSSKSLLPSRPLKRKGLSDNECGVAAKDGRDASREHAHELTIQHAGDAPTVAVMPTLTTRLESPLHPNQDRSIRKVEVLSRKTKDVLSILALHGKRKNTLRNNSRGSSSQNILWEERLRGHSEKMRKASRLTAAVLPTSRSSSVGRRGIPGASNTSRSRSVSLAKHEGSLDVFARSRS
jgi:hypothetical protein